MSILLILRATAPTSNNSTFGGQYVPTRMVAGSTYRVWIEFTNTSVDPWTSGTDYYLSEINRQTTWGVSRANISGAVSVAVNGVYRFYFDVVAPWTTGTYAFQWKMSQGNTLFGASSTSVNVQVVPSYPTVARLDSNTATDADFKLRNVINEGVFRAYTTAADWSAGTLTSIDSLSVLPVPVRQGESSSWQGKWYRRANGTHTTIDYSSYATVNTTFSTINFTAYSVGGQTTYINGVFLGTFVPDYSEAYTIYVTTSDGARMYFEGLRGINSWISQASTTYSYTTPVLTAGQQYSVAVEHFQDTGTERLYVELQSASYARTAMPSTVAPAAPQYDGYIALSSGQTSGTWQSASIPIYNVAKVGSSTISWTAGNTSANQTVTVQTSINNGSTWSTATNGGAITGLSAGTSLSNTTTLLVRCVLARTNTGFSSPTVSKLSVAVTPSNMSLRKDGTVYTTTLTELASTTAMRVDATTTATELKISGKVIEQGVKDIYLSDYDPALFSVTTGAIVRDANSVGGTLSVDNVTHTKGILTIAPFDATIDVNSQYTKFAASFGIDDSQGNSGTVVAQVYLDGVLNYTSSLITGASAALSINIDITNKNKIRLVVSDNGDGSTGDHAVWASARLLG